jgi:hypothetical protein
MALETYVTWRGTGLSVETPRSASRHEIAGGVSAPPAPLERALVGCNAKICCEIYGISVLQIDHLKSFALTD